MDEHASRDYDYVEWNGRTPYVAAPLHAAAPAQIEDTIWLATERELHYWTQELGVTVYEVRDAIAATGTRCARRVRAWLEGRLAA